MTNPLRVAVAVLATVATVLVIVLTPGKWSASAAQLMGPLRQPGEAAFIAAHRGDRAQAPENTLPAYEAAVTSGSDFLETDLQLTADGYAVLMHDRTVDRTTDGSGAVADLTLAQIRALDAGSWYDPSFAGTGVPTFADFLDVLATAPHVTALVELKSAWTVDDVTPLLRGIYFRGLQDRVVFASFSPSTLDALQAADPVIPRVLIRSVLAARSRGGRNSVRGDCADDPHVRHYKSDRMLSVRCTTPDSASSSTRSTARIAGRRRSPGASTGSSPTSRLRSTPGSRRPPPVPSRAAYDVSSSAR